MKKKSVIILVCLVTIILLSCVTTPSGNTSSEQRELDTVMDNWIRAMTTEDIDLLMSTYESNAIMEINFGGEITQWSGEEEIRKSQSGFFESSDGIAEISVSVIDRDLGKKIAEYTCELQGSGFMMINQFTFQKQDGEWKIIHQLVEPAPE
jgi:ketosteroid isomerase-like protein